MACLCDVGFGFVVFDRGVARNKRNQMMLVIALLILGSWGFVLYAIAASK